jgi:acetyl esterase/lipase
MAMFLIQQIQGVREMVGRGYVVAATDYPGLGTPETHPYLVGESEARAVLDSVRAARELTGAPARFAVWGHSQGGQAALFTGIMAKSYAPELDLVGVAAAAPATELETLLADDIDTNGGRNLTAMTLWSWPRVFMRRSIASSSPTPCRSLIALRASASSRSTTSCGGVAERDCWNSHSWRTRISTAPSRGIR